MQHRSMGWCFCADVERGRQMRRAHCGCSYSAANNVAMVMLTSFIQAEPHVGKVRVLGLPVWICLYLLRSQGAEFLLLRFSKWKGAAPEALGKSS